MSLLDILRRRIGNVKATLPFVKTFGHEKVYGRDRVKDYNLMIENFRSWVYACAQRNAYSIAKCELKLYRKGRVDGKLALTEIDEHPFLELMSKVNPFFNKFELWTLTGIFLELTGNNYWWVVSDGLNIPRELWNIPSNWVKVVPNKQTFISGYAVQPPGEAVPIPFDESEIIHFKYPSPFDLFYGTGPTLGAQYGVDLNNNLKTHAINYLMNNAQPSGALYTEDSLTDQQFQRLQSLWNAKYKGPNNAGKMAILEKGLKYQQIGQGLSELKFDDIARSIRDEILAIFGVPASQLGLVEDVNRASAEANDYVYQNGTVLPKLTLIEEKLNEKLMPRYDANLVVKFVSPVPADKEFRLKEQAEHIRSGYSSIDEERKIDDREPYDTPETSMPLIPFSVMPAGEERPDPYMPGSEDEEKEEKGMKDAKARRTRKWEVFAAMTAPQERMFKTTMSRYFQAQHNEVMRNLNNYRSINKEGILGVWANILFNMQTENERLKVLSRPHIREALLSGANLAGQELGIDWNLIEPRVRQAIDHRIDFFVEQTNKGTETLLVDEVKDAIANGESINDIAKRLDKVYNYSEQYRSVRIARTEVIGGANEGQLAIYMDAGVTRKEWITARDERVRDSHQIDGQEVGITEDFTTGLGNHMRYPGDRTSGAPAEDIINCRCSVNAVRERD